MSVAVSIGSLSLGGVINASVTGLVVKVNSASGLLNGTTTVPGLAAQIWDAVWNRAALDPHLPRPLKELIEAVPLS